MKKLPILIIGGGGHAHSCIDVIEQCGNYDIKGIVDTNKNLGQSVLGYPVIGTDKDLQTLRKQVDNAFIGVGQIKSADVRASLFETLQKLNFNMPAIISPLSYVSPHSKIGDGTIIMHGAIINANVTVGENSIINSNALVEHDTYVGDNCHISTSSVLNGGVKIKSKTFIGSGSVVIEGISVGKSCMIGASVLVRHNFGDGAKYLG